MSAKRKNYDEAVSAYESGLSVGNVAELFHVTRQAMWEILRKRNVKFRKHLKFGDANHFFIDGAGYTDRQLRARNLTMKAIANGVLIPEPCEKCGFEGEAKDGRNLVHAHHDDYGKPLIVRWLCKRCHHEEHYGEGSVNRSNERYDGRVLQRK